MPSDRSSLLALDSGMSEESIRVAVYDRAMTLNMRFARGPTVEEIANLLVAFVGAEHWRLDALDVALRKTDRRGTVAGIVEAAGEIVRWVRSEPEVSAEPEASEDEGTTEPEPDDEATSDTEVDEGLTLDDVADPPSQFKKRKKGKKKRR